MPLSVIKPLSVLTDVCNHFFSNFLRSYKMSAAKVKVAQNCHMCDESDRKLQAMLYTIISYTGFGKIEAQKLP